MKLFGAIAVYVQAEDILRAPGFFEKIKRAFGGKPDLRTGRVRAALEATAVVEAARDALRRIGVTNAIALVVDDTVLFQDKDGHKDDLGDLMVAFYDNESVFGQGFRELRLAVEHHEAGLHLVLELQARPEHPMGAAAVRVVVSGRIEALTPRPGEDAETYRKRAEPVATNAAALETYRMQFNAFIDRVRDALAAAMPTARVEVEVAEPRIVRPDGKPPEKPQQPDARNYDPYDYYYFHSPAAIMADAFMWSWMFSMMSPPHYVVVDHGNHAQGHADDPGIQDGPTDTSSAEADSSNWWDGDAADHQSDTVAEPGGLDDVGGGDSGGSWWDDVGGGDGFDFGGFD